MRKFIKSKKNILFLCFFVLLTCTACSNPRGQDGKTKVNEIIASEEITVKKSQVNTTELNDKALIKKYKKLDKDDTITIEPTSFSDAFSNGWFEGLVVWPLAQCINFFAGLTDAGIGVIITTILLQGIVFIMTYKSQMGNQRLQEVQPEVVKIQEKYRDKTDQRSQMMQAQEIQKIYEKYDIHPFGTMLVTFIQLPILMGMYYATMRAASVVYGSFLGIPFIGTPADGFTKGQYVYIVIWVLMILGQLLTMKMPQILKKWQDKKDHVKKKAYAEPKNAMMSSMNLYMYFMTAMIAFMAFNWPIAMSFYWFVSSLINIIKSVSLHFYMQKH